MVTTRGMQGLSKKKMEKGESKKRNKKTSAESKKARCVEEESLNNPEAWALVCVPEAIEPDLGEEGNSPDEERTISDVLGSKSPNLEEDAGETGDSMHAKTVDPKSSSTDKKRRSTKRRAREDPVTDKQTRQNKETMAKRSRTSNTRSGKIKAKTFTGRSPPGMHDGNLRRFKDATTKARYQIFKEKDILDQRKISLDSPDEGLLKNYLEKVGLEKTALNVVSYDQELVREVYAHLPEKATDTDVITVFVRGRYRELSVGMINEYYTLPTLPEAELAAEAEIEKVSESEIAMFLTGNKISLINQLKSTHILPKFSGVYRLCGFNWIPTTNQSHVGKERAKLVYQVVKGMKVSLGQLMFRRILHRGCHPSHPSGLPYPALIYSLLCTDIPSRASEAKVRVRFYTHEKTEEVIAAANPTANCDMSADLRPYRTALAIREAFRILQTELELLSAEGFLP